MSSHCDATVIIPQRNRGALTLACAEALRCGEPRCYPIVIIDDGSTDDSADMIESAAVPHCRVIRQQPRGVTAAWNAGIRAAETPFVVLLNNDVLIDGPFLDALLMPLRNRQAMIAGVEWRVEPLLPRCLSSSFPGQRLLAGWCFAFETDLWKRLGGFDALLTLYFSDTDFQCRAALHPALASARPVLSVPSILPLRHLGHQTTQHDPRRAELWQADRTSFLHKWKDAVV